MAGLVLRSRRGVPIERDKVLRLIDMAHAIIVVREPRPPCPGLIALVLPSGAREREVFKGIPTRVELRFIDEIGEMVIP